MPPLCLTGVKLPYIALCVLASVSFHKPDYSILPFYILNIVTTLLSPTELGHNHYIDRTCSYYCRLFCVPPKLSLAVSQTTSLILSSSTLTSYMSRDTTSETMVTFFSSSTLLTTLTTRTWVLWPVNTSMASVGESTQFGFAA